MYLPKSQYVADKLSELKDKITEELGTFAVPKGDPRKYSNYLRVLQNLQSGNPDVILTSTGEIFSRIGVDLKKGDFSNAIKLFPINPDEDRDEGEDLNSNQLSSESKIRTVKLPPSSDELRAGKMKRCFYKNIATGKISEILEAKALRLSNNLEKYEKVVCINWLVAGPIEDKTVNGYFLEGIESRNTKTLEELKKQLPGAEALIDGPVEFVRDIKFPEDDLPKKQDMGVVIPSPGKKL